MDFDSAKYIGLIGSVIILFGIVLPVFPFLSFLFSTLGHILILISLYSLSNIYGDRSIFRYAFMSITVLVVGILIVVIVLLMTVSIDVSPFAETPAEVARRVFMRSLTSLILLLAMLVIMVIMLLYAYFWYEAFTRLSMVSGVELFSWAAKLQVAGVILFILGFLTLIMLIGVFLLVIAGVAMLAGWVLLVAAFYTLEPPQEMRSTLIPATPV